MAEFNSYLLGKARKSVGNITLCYTRRKNIAKAKVFKRKDNPTPEILEQRAKMKTLVQFGRRILPVVRKGFAGVGRGTAFNAFVALNMDKVSFGAGSVAGTSWGEPKRITAVRYSQLKKKAVSVTNAHFLRANAQQRVTIRQDTSSTGTASPSKGMMVECSGW